MNDFIPAMGAEHVKPEKLRQIVNTINNDRQCKYNITPEVTKASDRLASIFDIHIKDSELAPLINQHYIVEEKYDGYDYLAIEGRMFSRRLSQAVGNEGNPVEKTGHVPHIANLLKNAYEMCGCDLQGELYVPYGISDDVTKILGCTEEEAHRRTQSIYDTYGYDKVLHYRLIDIRKIGALNITNEPYYIRRAVLEAVYNEYIKPYDKYGYIQLTEILNGDPLDEFRRIVNSGGEGIIMKRTNALYIPGKKPTDNWVKGKKKITVDVVITGYNRGTGKNAGLFGSIEFGLYYDGKLTPCGNCSSGLSDAVRQQIATDPDKYINTVMEITAMQESVKSFRNAVFIRLRDDKGPEECTPMGVMMNEDLI